MEDTTQKPVANIQVGNRLSLDIADLAFGGEGVARWHDLVIFIPFVIPGETVEVEIVEVKRNFARARLLQVIRAAPERVAPQCRYFGECGGCQYQHMDYAAQIRFKHKQITDLFQRVGGFESAVIDPVVPCPQPYGYRNRLMVRSQWCKPKQALHIGFLRADSRLVVDIEECQIAEPALNEQIRHVRAHPPPRGGLKVVIRISPDNWEVPKDSFFQNNFHLLPALVQGVRSCIVDSGARHLIDVYCGVGFFGIEMADLVESFIGVEVDKLAVQAARKNMASRAIANGQILSARAEDELPALVKRFEPDKTVVVLDPPRTGCPPESMKILREAGPRQIIYVSCHPATLARDLKILCEDGRYHLRRVMPFDMFPQTQHVECVSDLRRS